MKKTYGSSVFSSGQMYCHNSLVFSPDELGYINMCTADDKNRATHMIMDTRGHWYALCASHVRQRRVYT